MKTILVADDEKIIRDGIAGSIKKEFGENVNILTARNGKAALEAVCSKENHVDIVLTDIIMPELSGIELITECRKKNIPCEFIILSSYDDFSYAQSAIRNGVCEYILKPCGNKEIFETIKKVCNKVDSNKRDREFSIQTKNSILCSWFEGKTDFSQIKEYLGINTERHFRLFVLQYFLYSKTKSKVTSQKLFSAISQIESFIDNSVCFYKESHIFVLISSQSKTSCSDSLSVFEKIKNQLSGISDQDTELPETTSTLSETKPDTDSFENTCIAGKFPVIISEPFTPDSSKEVFEKVKETLCLLYYFKDRNAVYTEKIEFSKTPDAENVNAHYKELGEKIFNLTETEISEKEITEELKKIALICAKKMYSFETVKKLTLTFFLSYITKTKFYKDSDLPEIINVDRITKAQNFENLYLAAKESVSSIIKKQKELFSTNYTKQIRKVIEYVNKNYSDSALSLLKVTQEEVYMNPDYLGKLFKKETGQKFSTFLFEKRMEIAKELMEDIDLSIAEIAYKTGFGSNPSYFSQMFRKETGYTPSEYREKIFKTNRE